MADKAEEPTTELGTQFSSEGATAVPWARAEELLEKAEVYWLSTVHPDGRPHATPLIAIWLDGALYFSTGPTERKAKNLVKNAQCLVITGCNTMDGFDVVVEGEAVQVSDVTLLKQLASAYDSKYGWQFSVRDSAFYGEGGRADVYKIAPSTAFGFGKGSTFSQTRWRF